MTENPQFLEDAPPPRVRRNAAYEDMRKGRDEESLIDLEARIQAARMEFVDNIAESDIFTPGTTLTDDEAVIRRHQSNFTRTIVMSILAPLQEGVSLASVIQAATLARVAWLYSPTFRESVKDAGHNIYEGLNGEVRRRISVMKSRGQHDLAGVVEQQWTRLRTATARDDDRVPYTADSAGLAEVGLMMRAYNAVREEGADVEEVASRYGIALKELYKQAYADGIDPQWVASSSRATIARLIREDPSYATMFYETSFQDLKPADPYFVERDGKKYDMNAGKFIDLAGDIQDEGIFHIRPPMTAEEHRDNMTMSILRDLSKADSADELTAGISAYMIGYSAISHPEVRKHPDLNRRMRTAFAHVSSMVKGLHDDDIRDVEAQAVYEDALTHAVDYIKDVNPQLAAEWSVKYGDSWYKYMQGEIRDPEKLAHIWEGVEQKLRAESMSEAGNRGTYRSADYRTTEPGREHQAEREYPQPGKVHPDPPTVKTDRPDPGRPYQGSQDYPHPGAQPGSHAQRFLRNEWNQKANREKDDSILGVGSDPVEFNDPDTKFDDPSPDDYEPEF